jgi:hypothetical protein
LEQEFLDLSLGETMSAHDWRDRIGDFCVANYLVEFNEMHLLRYSTRVRDLSRLFVWSISRVARNPISGLVALHLEARSISPYAQLGSTLTISGERDSSRWR